MEYIELKKSNVNSEHICCAISDKKCIDGYNLKKEWLTKEFYNGYKFFRLNERAKVFIEFGPADRGWVPIDAPNSTLINCLWVSGKYKSHGHGKELLNIAMEDAKANGRDFIVTVVGKKKYHFLSDGKWFKKQEFVVADETDSGFQLLIKSISDSENKPKFRDCCKSRLDNKSDIVVYYSNRCPFTEYHINSSLKESADNRGLSLEVIKLKDYSDAQNSPSPGTIFSLYYKGSFITTDLSICMDSRFDKILNKNLSGR